MDEKIKKYRESMVAKLKEYGVTDEKAIKQFADELDESNGLKEEQGEATPNPIPGAGDPKQASGQQGGAESANPKAPNNANPNPNQGDPGKNPEGQAGGGAAAGGAESAGQQGGQPGQAPAPSNQAGNAPQGGQAQSAQAPTPKTDQEQAMQDLKDTIKGLEGRLKADEETIGKVMPILEKLGVKAEAGGAQFGAAPEPHTEEGHSEDEDEKKQYEEAQKRAGKRE